MLTAFMSPARCMDVSSYENVFTATRPSASYGNKAAAMPCTLRRVFWRASSSSTVIPVFTLGSIMGLALCATEPMSAFLRLLEFFGHVRVFVVIVQRITTRGQSVPRCSGAIAEGSANTLAVDLAPL